MEGLVSAAQGIGAIRADLTWVEEWMVGVCEVVVWSLI